MIKPPLKKGQVHHLAKIFKEFNIPTVNTFFFPFSTKFLLLYVEYSKSKGNNSIIIVQSLVFEVNEKWIR